MKIFVGFFLCLIFVLNAFGSPLIFKASKTIQTNESAEIANLDASKYQKLRIGIVFVGKEFEDDKSLKQLVLFAEKSLERNKRLLETGDVSITEVDNSEQELIKAKRSYETSKKSLLPIIQTYAVESDAEIFLDSFQMKSNTYSFVIEVPPTKLLIKSSGKGLYKIFVWANQ